MDDLQVRGRISIYSWAPPKPTIKIQLHRRTKLANPLILETYEITTYHIKSTRYDSPTY